MRYADLKHNDVANGPGINVSFWLQGCPNHCPECQNPETWDFNGGKEFTNKTLEELITAINENGVQRNLSILGGEPLCPENEFLTNLVITEVKKIYPEIKIYLWTGYVYDNLKKSNNIRIKNILKNIDYLIDGPYIQEQRDITLKMRGSRNQNIINLKLDRIENL